VKWLVVAAVVVVLAASAYLIRARVQSNAEKSREAYYEWKLREYAQRFNAGLTRREVEAQLRAGRIPFHQLCCVHAHGSVLTDLVKIGEDKGPWYCSGIWVNVAFDFHPTEAHDPLGAADTDVLDQVSMFRETDGCL
jgi:hypothetical protein